jgi:hypothetical protein
MGCLSIFFEQGEDVVKKDVLLDIIAKKVSYMYIHGYVFWLFVLFFNFP